MRYIGNTFSEFDKKEIIMIQYHTKGGENAEGKYLSP